MVKLPKTIFLGEIEEARRQGKHELPKAQIIMQFRREGYSAKKAWHWLDEMLMLYNEYKEDDVYIRW